MSGLKFFLNVCKDKSEAHIKQNVYPAGFKGQVDIPHSIKDDILSMDLEQCGHKPWLAGASEIAAVSIRICSDNVSIIAVYDDIDKNLGGECVSCTNGCSVYGHSGGGCFDVAS